jgi:uncharacterized protein YjdB
MSLIYKVGWKASTKEVEIKRNSENLTGGFTSLGTFDHHPGNYDSGNYDDNVVFYHYVRDKLYAIGVLDMQSIKIIADVIVNVTSISVLPATVELDLSAGGTQQLATTFAPTDTSDQRLTYASSDPTKATVSATGLVTAVGVGETTVTVTSRQDPTKTDTCVVTVVA